MFTLCNFAIETIKTMGLACLVFICLVSFVHAQAPERQYVLGSGDEIQIKVFGQDDLSVNTRLTNEGIIRYPFLGDIRLNGRTVSEIEVLIDKGLRGDYLVNPSVSVSIVEYRPFFIDGAIKKPGGYPFQPGLTIDKAAALAGGYSERAAKGEVIITRIVNGQETNIEIENKKALIYPGDIVTFQERFF